MPAGAPPPTDTQQLTLQQALDLALQHQNVGELREAISLYRQVLDINSNIAEAHYNLALALKGIDQPQAAAVSYRNALVLKPEYAEALNNLANLLLDVGDPDEAIQTYQQALAHNPDYTEAHNNLGKALADLGRYDAAEESYDTALSLRADYANCEYNRSQLMLLRGDFSHGWAGYEKRLVEGSPLALPDRGYPQPRWDGGALAGKQSCCTKNKASATPSNLCATPRYCRTWGPRLSSNVRRP